VVNREPDNSTEATFSNSDIAADPRLQRNVVKVRRLGDRVLFELATVTGQRATIESILARYAALDPDIVSALGGDQFPAQPTLRVVGGRHGSR
jgi:hypothetical protein